MGITTQLTDSVSLPIGSAEVNVIDQAAGYAVFANGGRRAKPYAAMEVRNSSGDVIYRHADEPMQQVLSTQVVADMNYMLTKVVEEGTGKRAALEGIKVAGKSGTTNAYRDAWFVGYTGNYVGAVWFGNDDHTSTNKMTGGSLPAMTWHDVMEVAHQGIELKPMPGLKDPGRAVAQSGQSAAPVNAAASAAGKLSRRSFEVIGSMNGLFRQVEKTSLKAPEKTSALEPLSAPGPVADGVRAVDGRIGTP
jgi:penicillin-binding protein 1A